MKTGRVFLVGAGPGAPGLITIRGLECLRRADVVLYDNLCNPSLLSEASSRAQIIFAGKHAGAKSLTQEHIHNLIVRHAHTGRMVVRLKGGDPFLFGRGAEEALHLLKHRIPFEIVPGVTSAIAVPAYAGISVTHRDHASGVAMITAQENPNKTGEALDYRSLAGFPGSLVVLMAMTSLGEISRKLIAAGKPPSTPVAVISSGTRGFQQTVTGNLGNIVSRVRQNGLKPPALAVIGEVVKCRRQLKWFENRPLFGKRIVVTRTREQASRLAGRLLELGAEVIELPTIEIRPVRSTALRRAVREIKDWNWIIFTSPWGVEFFLDEVIRQHGDVRVLAKAKLAVIGPETESKLKDRGLAADLMPVVHTAEALAWQFKILNSQFSILNSRALLPRSKIGRDVVERTLRKLGTRVQPLVIYRNVRPRLTWEIDALERVGADVVTFMSSSTAENFVKLLRDPKVFSVSTRRVLRRCKFVSIGPTTSATLRKLGLRVHGEAKPHTLDGLTRCLERL